MSLNADLGAAVAQPAPVRQARQQAKYCLAIDGTIITGLPDSTSHRLCWHEVKLAVGFDPQEVRLPFYVAGREDAEKLWPAAVAATGSSVDGTKIAFS